MLWSQIVDHKHCICVSAISNHINQKKYQKIYSQITAEVTHFQWLGEVLVSGDFNARTGHLLDFIPYDSINETFSDCPVPQDYSPDSILPRNHTDTQSNLHGELLTTLCKTVNLRILNGRFLSDSLCYCTFYNFNGPSWLPTMYCIMYCISMLCHLQNYLIIA